MEEEKGGWKRKEGGDGIVKERMEEEKRGC
jgi:hypothetical protein